MMFPGQPQVRYVRPHQPQLGESGHQPRPPVGLLGAPYPRCAPSQSLFEKAEGMLQVEAPDVGPPDEFQVRYLPFGTRPPKPQHARLAPPLPAWQPLYLALRSLWFLPSYALSLLR
jgi:hypothetical protein